jgi:sulfite reductase (ferredoxin)
VVGAIIGDAQKKVETARKLLCQNAFADAVYNAYTGFIIGAKATLLGSDIRCNTHIGILEDFQKNFIETADSGLLTADWRLPTEDFVAHVLQINQHEPESDFAARYVAQAAAFIEQVIAHRQRQLAAVNGEDKVVLENYRA